MRAIDLIAYPPARPTTKGCRVAIKILLAVYAYQHADNWQNAYKDGAVATLIVAAATSWLISHIRYKREIYHGVSYRVARVNIFDLMARKYERETPTLAPVWTESDRYCVGLSIVAICLLVLALHHTKP